MNSTLKKEIIRLYIEEKLSAPKITKKLNLKSYHPVYDILREEDLVRDMSECHKGQMAWNKGRKKPLKERLKISKSRKGKYTGKDNPNWKGGKVRTNKDPKRYTFQYKNWRKQVKARDKKCLECGSINNLHAHHITPIRDINDLNLLYDVNNGITLCKDCHKKTYLREKKYEKFYRGLLEKTVNSGKVLTDNAEDNPEPSSEGQKVSEKVQRLDSESQQ